MLKDLTAPRLTIAGANAEICWGAFLSRREFSRQRETENVTYGTVRRIPNCRYIDGAWRPHFDEYDVIKIHSIQ